MRLVTTPIFYVNGAPHIGHVHTLVLADALARFLRLRGEPVRFATGTDEHGLKIQRAAAARGVSPLELCDEHSAQFRALLPRFGIAADDFVRTTEPRHARAVDALWRRLHSVGAIRPGKHEGWYCVPDEAFLTPSQIDATSDPPRSLESGHPVEWLAEDNYMFALSRHADTALAFAQSAVRPAVRANEVAAFVTRAGLADLSVSRPTSRLSWGLPVPDDRDHSIYVWLDALANYLTVAGFPDDPARLAETWPPAIQVIGKDILRFHAVYWPAFLKAAGLALPQSLLVHAHWTVQGRKMSKSLGNVVGPDELLAFASPCAVRYFLLREASLANDSDYSHAALAQRYNADLVNGLGNLVARSVARKMLPDGRRPRLPAAPVDALDADLRAELASLPAAVAAHYLAGEFGAGLDAISACVANANRLFSVREPWVLRRSELPADQAAADHTLALMLEVSRVAAVLLSPVVPDSAARVLDVLGVPNDVGARMWATAEQGKGPALADTMPASASGVVFERVRVDK